MPDLSQILRTNVERILESRGWTMSRLANEIGMSPTQLSSILIGRNSPTLKVIEKIAAGLDVSVARLLATPEDLAEFEHDVFECHRRVGLNLSADPLRELASHGLELSDPELDELIDRATEIKDSRKRKD